MRRNSVTFTSNSRYKKGFPSHYPNYRLDQKDKILQLFKPIWNRRNHMQP